MMISTLDSSTTRTRHTECPYCGRRVDSKPRRHIAETGLSVLAGLVLSLMLVPLAVIVWKSCSDFISDKASHSIFYHPLEDWTRY
jgi:DNA-directed RNA polymerase subunit RPC12/RpoP